VGLGPALRHPAGGWKLLNEAPSRRDKPVRALFNLDKDVEEKHNLVDQEAAVARELTQTHER
jgi:hypothetical protein